MTQQATSDKILAWHFLASDWTAYGRFKVEVGKTYQHEGRLKACESGLHASIGAADAAVFSKGPVVTRVECGGQVKHHDEGYKGQKLVCSERTALWGYDATDELRAHARWCALQVVHLWKCPDVVKRYLESGDESIREEARDAAAIAAAAYSAANAYAAYAAANAANAAAAYAAYAAAANAAAYAANAAAFTAAANANAAAAYAAANAYAADAERELWARINADLEARLLAGAVKRGLVSEAVQVEQTEKGVA